MATGRSGNDGKLIEAARRCDSKTLEALVKEGKVNLNVKDKVGCTAVHLCCKSADLVALSLLLEHGARTDIFDNFGMAPIHYTAIKDYIETMAVLVSYGADVNIQNNTTKQTALHLASQNKKTRSIKFLLYCGADIERADKSGNIADLGLSKEERYHQEYLRAAYRDGHIKIFGKMINRYERWEFQTVGMAISNTSIKCKQFSLFGRQIVVANDVMNVKAKCGVRSYLKDGIELISDIYEYLVNQAVEEVWVSIPVYTTATDFDTVYVLDSTGSKFRCTEMRSENETQYYSAWIALRSYEDTVYSFAVVMETKSDTFMVTGIAQTLTSSVESDFHVQLPEGCLPKNTEVSVKVIPTTEYQPTLNTELIKSTSHFCEVKINQKNRRALTITLPVPPGFDKTDDTEVTVFHSDETTQTPFDWKEVESMWRPGSSHVTVTDKSIHRGTCIVTEVPKNKGNGILNKIKEFVAWLYDTAFKRKANVCFFAVTKYCSGETYRLLVGLCDSKMLNEHLNTMEENNYVGEYSQKSSGYLITPGSTFDACWSSFTESAKSSSSVSLVYQRQTLTHQDFVVAGKEHDFLQVTIFKRRNGNVREEEEKRRRHLTQINVELLINRAKELQTSNYSSLLFTEYPDNRFLSWLAQEIGHEWMMIGIGLGLKFSYLESIERDNTPTKTNLTMLYTWRNDQSPNEDIGLTALLHTLALAQRKDLVTKINKEVQELLKTKPQERVSKWIHKLSDQAKELEPDTEEGLDDVDGCFKEPELGCKDSHSERFCINCLTEPAQAASPLSEIFLVHIATLMGSNLQLILQLGLPQSVINEIRHTIREPTSAMLKCLLLAQRRYNDIVEFFGDLMEGLKMQGNLQTVRAIKIECKKWFKVNRLSVDKQMRRLEQVMDRY